MAQAINEKPFENKIKHKILERLRKCWYFKYWAGPMSKIGVPDLIAVVNGRFVALEVKGSSGRPSDLQLKWIAEIQKCGGYGKIVYPNGFIPKKIQRDPEQRELYADYDEVLEDLLGIAGGWKDA